MIFKETAQQMLDRSKWQTRRPVKREDRAEYDAGRNIVAVYRKVSDWDFKTGDWRYRLLWKVGETYAIQPGRGKKSIGSTPPIEAIRAERLWDISIEDCKAEGITNVLARFAFETLWNSLYRNPYRWQNNPEVWVLEFERVAT